MERFEDMCDQLDAEGNLTKLAMALGALADHGCDCGTDEPGTCLGCLCEAALREQFAEIVSLRWKARKLGIHAARLRGVSIAEDPEYSRQVYELPSNSESNMSKNPSGPAEYCVAIGVGAQVSEHSYGEIQIATPSAKLRALVDGTLEVNGLFIGKDEEVVRCLRSLLGHPLPDFPNLPEIPEMFFDPEDAVSKTDGHYNTVCIGIGAAPAVSEEIVFRNKSGVEFRIKPGGTVSPRQALASLRELFQLSNDQG